VALSYDVGHEKPDRRIFDAATEMLAETVASKDKGLTINDFDKLYVGDDLEKDYDGAKAAGWYAVLLDRGGVMKEAKKFRFGQVGMEDQEGKERKVLMARSLNDLELWPTKKTLDPSNV
jgi:ribonucleotide monophosphatase NagD (HAD superfamily)